MSDPLSIWWSILCTAAVVNVAAWGVSARALGRREAQLPSEVRATRRLLLWLSAAYVLGCGFRSVFPMVDVPRICLHDTWISRIFVGRSVATVAELCFAAQWALLLREASAATGGGFAALVSRLIVPIIFVAELFSWAAVLTANFLLHAAENSLWTITAALAVAAFVSLRPHFGDNGRGFLAAAMVCAAGYVAFMTIVDVPMYLSRWRAALAAGHEYLTLREGLHAVLQRCIVERDWAAWRLDVSWLSLYFTVAVWISIALPHAPTLAAKGGLAVDTRG